jgi:hypothetical protein
MKQTLANLKIFYEKYFIAKQIEPKIFQWAEKPESKNHSLHFLFTCSFWEES